jgi:hypothetical protein
MHIMPPFIGAAEKTHLRAAYHHGRAAPAIDIAETSGQRGQKDDSQPTLDSINFHMLQNTPEYSLRI